MKIHLELYASLMEYLPPGQSRHRREIHIDADDTPHTVIDRLNIPRERAHLVLKNGVYVTPLERNQAIFQEGDVFAIWPPVAGG